MCVGGWGEEVNKDICLYGTSSLLEVSEVWSPAAAYAALKSFFSVLGAELLLEAKFLSSFMAVSVKSN